MTNKTYQLTDERLRWMGDTEPRNGELVYIFSRRYSIMTLCVVRVCDFDGGRSGNTFFKVYDLGPVGFHRGELRVPEYDLEALKFDREYKAQSIGDEVYPRSPNVDSLVPAIVGLRDMLDEAQSDHKKLEESLTRIFGNIVKE